MDNGWFNSLAFVFGMEAHKQKKKRQEEKAFIEERRTDLCNAAEKLFDIIERLVTACGPVGLPKDFVEESKLLSLYAIGEVLSAQGKIVPEQEVYLKIWMANLNPMFNYAQFTQAAIHRTGVYERFQEIMGLTARTCGSFWKTLFETMYRSRLIDLFQEIGDCLTITVWNFSYLAGRTTLLAEPIGKRIRKDMEYWANTYQQTPYIHALMLLQVMLRDKKDLPIERQLLLRGDDIQRDGRNYFVFGAFERSGESSFGPSFGRYAVRELRSVGEKLDEHDRDLIFCLKDEGCEVFYDEAAEKG